MENSKKTIKQEMTPLQCLGNNIRMVRQSQGFSVTLLADYAGVSRPLLNRIEAGVPTVAIGSVYAVLLQLGLAKDLEKVAFRPGLENNSLVYQQHRYFRSGLERDKKRYKY